MKIKYFSHFLKLIVIAGVLVSFPLVLLAKEISLYDQPKSNAKVVATVDLSAGIIPIYTPKESEWIKIADPRNGNVGWVKSNELSGNTPQSIFTFTQRVDNNTPTTYRIIQFGQPSKLTPEQTKALAKQIQAEKQAMQKSIQSMMRNMDQLFYNDWYFLHHENFPFFAPVVILPVQNVIQPPQVNKQVSNKPTK